MEDNLPLESRKWGDNRKMVQTGVRANHVEKVGRATVL
jgi:hypothetical protein